MRQQLPTLKQATATYAAHRPVVQRIITTTFILYVVGTSYNAFIRPGSSGNSSRGGRKSKSDAKKGGKAPRVEVSSSIGAPLSLKWLTFTFFHSLSH